MSFYAAKTTYVQQLFMIMVQKSRKPWARAGHIMMIHARKCCTVRTKARE
jgi:hypothetical protein